MDYVTNFPITVVSKSQLTMQSAADATSHLFFAYLRSLTMDSAKGLAGISRLPMSLQKLLKETDYPPESLKNMHTTTPRVLMIVDSVSPTPFALLRRANHFQYRDEDKALMEFSEYIDPIEALTDECKRVLQLIASSNQSPSTLPDHFGGTTDASWSRFEDLGFSCAFDEKEVNGLSLTNRYPHLLEKTKMSKNSMGRPTTPSWAEFLSSGFVDELKSMPSPLALPPDLSLPPIESLGQNSQPHGTATKESQLEPGELASIAKFYLDDSFWWVWICSLGSEETPQRKAAFGRCTLIETVIPGGKWLLIEEKVKGAVSSPIEGAYIAEKKGFWGRSKRSRGKSNRKSPGKLAVEGNNSLSPKNSTFSKTSAGSDTHARIQAAAARLHEQEKKEAQQLSPRTRKFDDVPSMKTSSVFTLQPMIIKEASPAMKWAKKYDTNGLEEEKSVGINSRRSSGDPLSKSKLPLSPSKFETRSHGSQPVSPIALDSSQSSMHLQNSPNTSRFSTTPKFTKYQTNSSVQSSGTALQENQSETDQAATQVTETRLTDLKASDNQAKFAGKSPKKSSSGSGIKRLFSRNKAHDTKVGAAPPQVTNGREALERKKTGSSIGRSLSALRKKSVTPSGQPSTAASISPASPTPEFKSAQNSPREHGLSRSGPTSEFDNLSRVSTSEVQKAQIVFSSFDQGPIEDSQAPLSLHVEDIDESVVSAVSPITTNSGDENETSPFEFSSEINKGSLEKLSKEQRQNKTQSEASSLSDTNEVKINEEETIETRVAKIKARVAELTGNVKINEKAALSPSA
ncbi:hypothetical protein Golomagni_03161 [Golovinomyces magnicellulatus]|nr:hypothetical protein Golomagni_03161 [Golovinomyces magnicellulatus]